MCVPCLTRPPAVPCATPPAVPCATVVPSSPTSAASGSPTLETLRLSSAKSNSTVRDTDLHMCRCLDSFGLTGSTRMFSFTECGGYCLTGEGTSRGPQSAVKACSRQPEVRPDSAALSFLLSHPHVTNLHPNLLYSTPEWLPHPRLDSASATSRPPSRLRRPLVPSRSRPGSTASGRSSSPTPPSKLFRRSSCRSRSGKLTVSTTQLHSRLHRALSDHVSRLRSE